MTDNRTNNWYGNQYRNRHLPSPGCSRKKKAAALFTAFKQNETIRMCLIKYQSSFVPLMLIFD